MNFEIGTTPLEGVLVIKIKKFHDERGYFSETYRHNSFESIGIPDFVQDNFSESKKGVIRGLHWQSVPHGQGKLVSCLKGRILDVAVDIRRDSDSFGDHFAIELNANNGLMLWIPGDLAHGFQSLEDETWVSYKVTDYWNKEAERSLNPLDSKLGITWNKITPILSDKDRDALSFESFNLSPRN
jgi:dTDP-4-dehydrorhamnose 3,5-epimerase